MGKIHTSETENLKTGPPRVMACPIAVDWDRDLRRCGHVPLAPVVGAEVQTRPVGKVTRSREGAAQEKRNVEKWRQSGGVFWTPLFSTSLHE